MDDLTGKLQELLSDPESMQNLADLAGMLGGAASGDGTAESGSAEPDGGLPPLDFSKLLLIGQALGEMKADENAAFLTALRPHLSAQRQARVNKAIRMLQILRIAAVLRENGLLDSFFGGDARG